MKLISMMSKKMRVFSMIFLGVLVGFVSFTIVFYSAVNDMKRNMAQSDSSAESVIPQSDGHHFRNEALRDINFNNHGKEMGFSTAEEYELAAASVIDDPDALHKTDPDSGYDIYYLESNNEYVEVATWGFITEFFSPEEGREYFDNK